MLPPLNIVLLLFSAGISLPEVLCQNHRQHPRALRPAVQQTEGKFNVGHPSRDLTNPKSSVSKIPKLHPRAEAGQPAKTRSSKKNSSSDTYKVGIRAVKASNKPQHVARARQKVETVVTDSQHHRSLLSKRATPLSNDLGVFCKTHHQIMQLPEDIRATMRNWAMNRSLGVHYISFIETNCLTKCRCNEDGSINCNDILRIGRGLASNLHLRQERYDNSMLSCECRVEVNTNAKLSVLEPHLREAYAGSDPAKHQQSGSYSGPVHPGSPLAPAQFGKASRFAFAPDTAEPFLLYAKGDDSIITNSLGGIAPEAVWGDLIFGTGWRPGDAVVKSGSLFKRQPRNLGGNIPGPLSKRATEFRNENGLVCKTHYQVMQLPDNVRSTLRQWANNRSKTVSYQNFIEIACLPWCRCRNDGSMDCTGIISTSVTIHHKENAIDNCKIVCECRPELTTKLEAVEPSIPLDAYVGSDPANYQKGGGHSGPLHPGGVLPPINARVGDHVAFAADVAEPFLLFDKWEGGDYIPSQSLGLGELATTGLWGLTGTGGTLHKMPTWKKLAKRSIHTEDPTAKIIHKAIVVNRSKPTSITESFQSRPGNQLLKGHTEYPPTSPVKER